MKLTQQSFPIIKGFKTTHKASHKASLEVYQNNVNIKVILPSAHVYDVVLIHRKTHLIIKQDSTDFVAIADYYDNIPKLNYVSY